MTEKQQIKAAKEFVKEWKDKGDEKQHTQMYWAALLRDVFGIDHPESYIQFEGRVIEDRTVNFEDCWIPSTKVLIEQKSSKVSLDMPIRQSNGTYKSSFEQAEDYANSVEYDRNPRWIVCCNFKEIRIHDMNKNKRERKEPVATILLEELPKEYYRLNFLVDKTATVLPKEVEVSIEAGNIVGTLYDALSKQYYDLTSKESQNSLNVLCVRLVFCFYAEDSGLFGKKDMFHNFMVQFKDNPSVFRKELISLFRILNTKNENRDPYDSDDLNSFPYVNGGLFADEHIEIPMLNDEIIDIILNKASLEFDWSSISPTIFGAVFESTLNPETRRQGGMHYTSIENIHKVIDPLFLNDLEQELEEIKNFGITKRKRNSNEQIIDLSKFNNRAEAAYNFQQKLSKLKFLDPAAGSGNFLTETYISLRRLENEAIRLQSVEHSQMTMDLSGNDNPVKVNISQFYGMEINDFAVTVAKTALWIAESQMLKETEEIVHLTFDFLPLKTNAHIIEGNALELNWNDIIDKRELDYIMGNPPFIGARLMSKTQKLDVKKIFSNWKNAGNLDYVACWYKKTFDLIKFTNIKAALVSTNSIVQGENISNLWKPLFDDNIRINFAYRTFIWDSEANNKAHVHCVIIGFSHNSLNNNLTIFDHDQILYAKNINAYLMDADNIFIDSRTTPLCDVPGIGIGNKPIDDGNYLFSKDEMNEFIKSEPKSESLFRPWYGAAEFINQKPRYCLWLGQCNPSELKQMPKCLERIKNVRKFRLASKSEGTRKLAERPTHFHVENIPNSTYLLIPRVSSERRKYIPIGFMSPEILTSDSAHIIPNASLYHFGILTSSVHMNWMRTVAGRLESRYRYSKDIVYNNFPWPTITDEYKKKIEQTAQAILDTRSKYPESSLADLYDPLTMPADLLKAHLDNDRAVLRAYGFDANISESDCVVKLMNMYQEIIDKLK